MLEAKGLHTCCWYYGKSRRFARWPNGHWIRSVACGRIQQDAGPTSTPMPSPNASLWGRHGMEKQGLGHFSTLPSNHRVAEFHRLIINGHFWGKATPFFSRSPSPSWAVLGGPDLIPILSIAH
ncbi:hypothetical protein V8C26DRAFT_28151 [Trichoderma gracile]